MDHARKRQLLLESLEARQLLAVGPRLAGIQPNNSDLFDFASVSSNVRHVAPRELTVRFDETQHIDPASLAGIRVLRSGFDGVFGNGNDQLITPGFIGVASSPKENEVVIRFTESLPDDVYTIEILGAGNATPLRNTSGDSFTPTLADSDGDLTKDTVRFELDLGPQVVAVVPQPVSRNIQGALVQARHQIQVFFNSNDPLFIANDDLGKPTAASAENPNFYQLIFTNDTVSNTDDVIVKPTHVEYDPGTGMATLTFAQDLDRLRHPDTNAVIGPGTFRLRIGTDEAAPLPPQRLSPLQVVSTNFGTQDEVVLQFLGVRPGEQDIRFEVANHDLGGSADAPRVRVNVVGQLIHLDLNRNLAKTATARDVVDAINGHEGARRLVAAQVTAGDPATLLGNRLQPGELFQFQLEGQGASYDTATNLTADTDVGPVVVVTGSGSSFEDGDFFQLTDRFGQLRKFEFDRNVPRAVNDPASIAIAVSDNLSQANVAAAIVSTINGASFGIRATLAGNRVRLEGDLLVDLSGTTSGLAKDFQNGFDNGQVLEVTRGGDSFTDGDTFQITDQGQTVTFEFDEGLYLQLGADSFNDIADQETFVLREGGTNVVFEFVDTRVDDTATGTNVPVRFDDSFTTRASLAEAIVAAINGQLAAGVLHDLTPRHLGGGLIHLGGRPDHDANTAGTANLSHDASRVGLASPGNIAVRFISSAAFTSNDVARAIADAVQRATFHPNPQLDTVALAAASRIRFTGNPFIQEGLAGLQTTLESRFDAGPVLVVSQGSAGFADGQSLRIRDSRQVTRVFEFDLDGALVDPTAQRVSLVGAATAEQVARRLADAIQAAGFDVQATVVGNQVHLVNDRQVDLDSGISAITASSQGLIIASAIQPQPFGLDFPGASSDPGHRDLPEEIGGSIEQHINREFADLGRDSTPGVTTILYNFRSDLGGGFANVITEQQRIRAREAFQMWGRYLGVQFIESASEGLTVATADLNALPAGGPNVLDFSANNFRVRIDPKFANGLLLMDSTIAWNSEYGDPAAAQAGQPAHNWFLNAMVGVGSLLGLELANDLPISNLMSRFTGAFRSLNAPDPEPVFPGNADILHGQHLYRPDGVDVDLYRFEIDLDAGRQGLFTAETFAERLANSSLLDTVLHLYRENPDGTRELLATNDDYFSRDSLIEVSLGAGVYYIGIAASGNENYDPTIDRTGLGGRSQGSYELRLNFRSQVEDQHAIRDADGPLTLLDGDSDGAAGGVYNFWFQTQPLDRIVEVLGDGREFRDGQIISITNSNGAREDFEFNATDGPTPGVAAGNVAINFLSGAGGPFSTAEQIAAELATKISNVFGADPNDGFAKAIGNQLLFNSSRFGRERQVQLSAGLTGLKIHGRTLFVDKTAGPNADGSAGKPFNNIARNGITNAFSVAQPGDIVRIVGNGGTDGNPSTLPDNFAYEIGFGTLSGQILSDGTDMAVPRGVTVMVEPGTVFKMRRSRVGVGSSSTTVDRSGGALQVLGTPQHRVYFTSWLDQSIGLDTHPPVTTPAPGDWGGIMFRTDVDAAESRLNLEDEGIFLNHVNLADIRFGGGGNVVIDGIQQVVNPIEILQARPTVSFNRITRSADSAMSATPDSFDETNFHAPRFQKNGEFTSDYQRVGPDVYGNFLANNSNNALFIRIETPAGDAQRPLTVAGRFDDTDIVHVLSENLIIRGSEGVPFLDLARPSVAQITSTPEPFGFLDTFTTYFYKMTFVDANGFEGRPSDAKSFTTGNNTALRLDQLPPAEGDFVRRRIYRTDDPAKGYQLVAELNASDRVFVDNLPLQSAVLQRDPPSVAGVTLTDQPRGSLPAGTYNYRVVFVDAQGREGASSDPTASVTLGGTAGGVVLDNLPAVTGQFVARRLYRSTDGGITPYQLVTELDATSTRYVDDGLTQGGTLDVSSFGVIRARPHARLAIDPGMVIKMEGARIEAGFRAQLLAEGLVGREVVITSRLDDAYGAGGTFDTNNDDSQGSREAQPRPGDWSGLYFGPLSTASIDHALIAFGGGVSQIAGTFAGFNVIEVHQADLRLTHSIIEDNAEGVGGQGPLDRLGHTYNLPGTIFVRGAQPVIVDNIFRDNNTQYDPAKTAAHLQMPVITINANSLTSESVVDTGRSRGLAERITGFGDNAGPLVRRNRLTNNAINAMVVRGEELTTQGVWDDTDIVHVLTNQFDQQDARNTNRKWAFDEVVVLEHHTLGGLRLASSPTESLVVKFLGTGRLDNSVNLVDDGAISNRNPYDGAGITVTGRRFEIDDRVGGSLHIVGQPGFPVVLTSLNDDSVGAGVQPDDSPQTDTNNNGIATIPRPNDWRSIRLDQFSNDRNVDIVMEMESPQSTAPGLNATTNTAQVLGDLAANEQSGDENLRMGFEVHGIINEPNDVDVYGFNGTAGTEIFIDIDRTTYSLDTVVELLDSNGAVLARSDDAIAEVAAGEVFAAGQQVAAPLRKFSGEEHQSGLYKDFLSTNPRDAGMRVVLPGNVGTRGAFHIRVRSRDGLTTGSYLLQIRTREAQEFPGSTVRYAHISYANNGIEVYGLPGHSPLLGEAAEDEAAGANATFIGNNNFANNGTFTQSPIFPGNRPQDVGNLLASDRAAISIAGTVASRTDVDIYTFDVVYQGIQSQNRVGHYAPTTFDLDYADALVRFNSTVSVFDQSGALTYIGRDSNVAEDRPGPLEGNDLDDLSRGSVGQGDPFIGPVELAEGSYFAAVTSNGVMPAALDQFTNANSTNSLVRLEPVNSLIRIAEDHIGSSGGSTALPPVVPELLDPTFVGTGPNRWIVTDNRAGDAGHGLMGSDVPASGLAAASANARPQTVTRVGDPPSNQPQLSSTVAEVVGRQRQFAPDRLIVRFDPNMSPTDVEVLLRSEQALLVQDFGSVNAALVELPAGSNVLQAAAHWSLKEGIEFAEPDYILTTQQTFPNDPSFGQLYGLHNTGQTGGRLDADIDAPEIWDTTTGSGNIVVAVIDSGIDYTHPDLAGNMWRNPGEIPGDGVDNDANGFVDDVFGIDTVNGDSDPMDDDGHGTHVAGTIGAVGNNGVGVTGVNWDVQLMGLKFLDATGSGPTSAAIAAINYMTRMRTTFGVNIAVSNNSWGGLGFSQALVTAIDASIQAGILFVAAAGNFGLDNDVIPFYPASYDLPGIISVAASDQNDQLASFSHRGRVSVDIAAPGVNILSTLPGNSYGLLSGTSMASPHVAGVAALVASQQPGASPLALKNAILSGADRLASLAGTSTTSARLNAAGSLQGTTGGDSFYFGDPATRRVPNNSNGSLLSNPFDLKGYSPQDLPTFYFNYYLNSDALDTFNVVVVESNGTETVVASTTPSEVGDIEPLFQGRGGIWRQARINLGPFAGREGLRLRFDYRDNSPGRFHEGVYVDDLIIGFAERGERVYNASPSSQFITNPKSTASEVVQGNYQLEIRSSTEFATYDPGLDAQVLQRSFDTNDRLATQTTLIAPDGSQVIDGQTFQVSDGVSTVTFEYEDPQTGSGVVAGHVEIRYKSLVNGTWVPDRDYQIARRIRDAINSPQLQTTLQLTAALADGEVTGTRSTSNRVNLFGAALVDQPAAFSVTETTTDANRLRDTILGAGIQVPATSRVASFQGSDNSAGFFVGGGDLIGLHSGIVLSTGDVRHAAGPNTSDSITGRASGSGDPHLDDEFGVTTTDSTSLEFDFEFSNGTGGDLFLNFVLASDEYTELTPGFLDSFAVLLDQDADGDYVNISLLPATNQPASLATVNATTNSSLFRGNDPEDGGRLLSSFGFDGLTTRLVARAAGLGPGPHRLKIVLSDVGDQSGDTAVFVESLSLSSSEYQRDPEGIRSVRHDGRGDQNLERPQGVVLIHSNTISHTQSFGIVADAGERDSDGQKANTSSGLIVAFNGPLENAFTLCNNGDFCVPDVIDFVDFFPGGFSTDFAQSLTDVKLQNPHPGPSRNLVVENLPDHGGFASGLVVSNNTVNDGGIGGIHVSGSSRMFELMPQRPPLFDNNGAGVYPSQITPNFTAGDMVNDGSLLVVTAYGQTVTFEFEDLSGSGVDNNRWATTGSATVCGDGWAEGNIPIFYRRTGAACTTVGHHQIGHGNRTLGYNQIEMAIAIKDAIDSSSLVSNDSTLAIQAQVSLGRHPGGDDRFSIHGLPGPGPNGEDPVVYLDHVSAVTEVGAGGCTFSAPGPGCVIFANRQLSIAHGPQPFHRVVNNTVFGSDGNYSFSPEPAVEPNDTLGAAIDTRQGRQPNPQTYRTTAQIGDTTNFRGDRSVDVDFYQFQLDIGDHVVIDVDAVTTGSTLVPMLRLFNEGGQQLAVSRGSAAAVTDPLIDFTATVAGTYFVGVSAVGNEVYSPISLSDRVGAVTTGPYTIDVNVRAPRQYMLTVQNATAYPDGEQFRIEDVTGRVATFEFDTGGGVAAGNIPILINAAWRHPEVARAIEQAINANNNANNPNPAPLSNKQQLPNGRFGLANPVLPVSAEAFGGGQQERFGLQHFSTPPHADSERQVLIRNIAQLIDVNSGIIFSPNPNNPLNPTPDNDGRNTNPTIPNQGNTGRNDRNQIILERGILVSEQATPTVLNNVLANLRVGVEQVDFQAGSDGPVDRGAAVQGGMIEVGSLYQDTLFNSNIPFGVSDFNTVVPPGDPLFVDAAAGNFFPAPFALSIDSSIDVVQERAAFMAIRQSIGLALSPVLAPDRDASGQLRVDDPDVATPSGQGANVFKDRGALDRSDFVGPAAVLVLPQDNDARRLDRDSALSVVQLDEGIFASFSIQLVDGFEAADPFPGVGVDDDSVAGRTVTIEEDGIQLQVNGPAVTIFQNGTFLREGLDYTFRYDRTSNTIVLTPLAGIWPDDKVYVIGLNNRDRFVIDAPSAGALVDGQTFQITNNRSETATYEFDSGFSLQITPTLGLQVPLAGAGTGGIVDGQRFSIETNSGRQRVTFEFDRNVPPNVVAGNEPIPYTQGASQDEIAEAIRNAILRVQQDPVQPRLTNLIPRNLGGGLVNLGATPDTLLSTSNTVVTSTIAQRPFSLIVPAAGAAAIADNSTFVVRNGLTAVTFEFDKNGSGSSIPGSRVITLQPGDSQDQVASLLASSLSLTALNLRPVNVGGGVVELNGTSSNSVDVTGTALSRAMFVGGVVDDERFTVSQRQGNTTKSLTIEFDNDGSVQSTGPNVAVIPFSFQDSHLELANRVVAAIKNGDVGLNPVHVGGGSVNLGGDSSHGLDTRQAPNLSVSGQAGARPSTTLTIPSNPALLVPSGAALVDGARFSISNGIRTVIFEFDRDGVFTDADNNQVPDNQLIRYQTSFSATQIAALVSASITSMSLGIAAQPGLGGVVLLNGLQPNHVIDLTGSGVVRADRITGISDGQTFTIDDGVRTVTFEFENLVLSNGVAAGNEPILFDPNGTVAATANTMAAVIRNAGLGLNPVVTGGSVELRDQPRHMTDVAGSNLTKSGVPGGSRRVVIRTNATDDEVAQAIVAAINAGADDPGFDFDGVTAQVRGGSTLFVNVLDSQNQVADFASGTAAIRGISSFFVEAIKDLPGNPLKLNQSTDQTQFTILLPGVELDFGDAPDPFTGPGRYPTLFDSDGARHVLTDVPLFLGTSIDADPDGQPTPSADGDDADHLIDVTGSNLSLSGLAPYSIQVPAAGGAAIADGNTFRIRRFTGDEVVFEFNSAGGLSNANHARIDFLPGDTANELADKIVQALSVINRPVEQLTPIEDRINRLALRPANLGGGVVFVGGGSLHRIDVSGSSLTVTGSPASLLQVPAGGGASIIDGETVVFDDGIRSVILEFNQFGGFDSANHIEVPYAATDSVDDIVAALRAALPADLRITLTDLGNGLMHVQGLSSHTLDLSGVPALDAAARAPVSMLVRDAGLAMQITPLLRINISPVGGGSIADGQSFTIDDGINPVVKFEFDRDAAPSLVDPTARRIAYNPTTDNQEAIADRIVAAVAQAVSDGELSGLSPVKQLIPGGFAVNLGAGANHRLNTAAAQPGLNQTGPVLGGDTFTIDGEVFEFVRAGTLPTPPNLPIVFDPTDSTDAIVNKTVTAIKNAVLTAVLPVINPVNLGGGVIDLATAVAGITVTGLPSTGVSGGIADGQVFTIQAGTSTVTFEFDRNGKVNTGNRAVPFQADDNSQEIAAAITDVVRTTGLNLAVANLGNQVRFEGSDDDGVVFNGILKPGSGTTVTVTASSAGFLSAWFDWNQDGDWDDPGEHVFTDVLLAAGPNVLTVNVPALAPAPSTLPLGDTIARFRFSSKTGLLPTGLAEDGEVEDYKVRVIANTSPALVQPLPDRSVNENFDSNPADDTHVFQVASFFNDVDLHNGNGDFLRFSVVNNNPTLLTASIDAITGTLTLQLAEDRNGIAELQVTVTDHDGRTAADVFRVQVAAINGAPTAGPSGILDPPILESSVNNPVRLPADDGDPEVDQPLTFNVLGVSAGTLVDDPNSTDPRDFRYTPPAGFVGNATVRYRVTDSGGLTSNEATITLVVESVNDPPTFTLAGDTVGSGNLAIGEDAGAQSRPQFVRNVSPGSPDEAAQTVDVSVTNVSNAALFSVQPALVRQANGTYTLNFTAASQANGSAVVTVTATDSDNASSVQSFTITVNAVNDAPVVTVPAGTKVVREGDPLLIPGIQVSDVDAAEGTGLVRVTLQVARGTITVSTTIPNGLVAADIQGNNTPQVVLTATPARINATLGAASGLTYRNNSALDDSLAVQVSDLGNTGQGGTLTDSDSVPIDVLAINSPPVLANPIGNRSILEDGANLVIELFPAVFNDPDIPNGDTLTFRVVSVVPPTGTSPVTASIAGSLLTLAVVPNAVGQALVTVEAQDRLGLTVRDSFTLTVTPQNDPPIAQDDQFTVPPNATTVLNVLQNDTDVDSTLNASSVIITVPPNNATATVNANGTISFRPITGFLGSATFRYRVSDTQGASSNEAQVTVLINNAPVAGNDAATTQENKPVVINVIANDQDVDGALNPASVSVRSGPANGAAVVNPATGAITYTPNPGFDGTDTFRYVVSDAQGAVSNEATVTVTVTPVRHWTNTANPMDVTADGNVAPIDVLVVVNKLNRDPAGPLPDPVPGNAPPPYYDANADGQITFFDALVIINFLNRNAGGGEGEGEGASSPTAQEVVSRPGDGDASLWSASQLLVAPAFRELRLPGGGYSPEDDEARVVPSGTSDARSDMITGHARAGSGFPMSQGVVAKRADGEAFASEVDDALSLIIDDLAESYQHRNEVDFLFGQSQDLAGG